MNKIAKAMQYFCEESIRLVLSPFHGIAGAALMLYHLRRRGR